MELVVTVKFPQMKEPKTEEKEGTISDLFKIFFFLIHGNIVQSKTDHCFNLTFSTL